MVGYIYIYIRYPPRHVFNGFCGICTLPTQVWTCLSQVWTCPSEVWQVHLSGSKIQDFSRRVSGHLGSWIFPGLLDPRLPKKSLCASWILDLGSESKKSFLEILDLGSKHYRPEVFKSRLSDLRFSSLVLVSLVLAYLEFYVELTWRSWHSDPICCSGTVFVVASFVTQSCFPSCVTSTSMAILAAGSATLQDNQAVVSHAGPAATAYTRPVDRVITGQVPVHESRQPATTQPVGLLGA